MVLADIDGVVNYGCWDTLITLSYDPTQITPEQLDDQVIATGLALLHDGD